MGFSMIKRSLVAAAVLILMTGCASTPHEEAKVDPALLRLAEAADSIAQGMTRLAKIESSQSDSGRLAQQYEFNTSLLPEVWRQKVVLVEDYYGTIEDFIRLISVMLDLEEPRVMGTRPASPIMVGLNRSERAAMEFIADAGYQAGQGVLVRPMINDRQVLLQYR